MYHVLSSPSATVPVPGALAAHKAEQTSTKDVREDVLHSGSTTATLTQALFSIPIVQVLLLRVSKYFICKTDLLKLTQKYWINKKGQIIIILLMAFRTFIEWE